MANININNILDSDLNGNNLFEDSESFMTEIDDQQEVVGGSGKEICCGDGNNAVTFYCPNSFGGAIIA